MDRQLGHGEARDEHADDGVVGRRDRRARNGYGHEGQQSENKSPV